VDWALWDIHGRCEVLFFYSFYNLCGEGSDLEKLGKRKGYQHGACCLGKQNGNVERLSRCSMVISSPDLSSLSMYDGCSKLGSPEKRP